MKFINKKFPRGIIYHDIHESLIFIVYSFFSKLNNDSLVRVFEKKFSKFVKQDYAVSFPFARTGLFYILKSLNLPKKSKILMPPITIKGMLDVINFYDLEPVYIDYDQDTFNLDIKKLKSKDLNNISVSLLTPLYGNFPNVQEIEILFKENNIFSILDFSHQLNSKFKDTTLPNFFDCSVYSSSSIKTLDTLGGGHVTTNNKFLYQDLIIYQSELKSPNRLFLIKKSFINLFRNLATSRFFFNVFTFFIIRFFSLIKPGMMIKQTGKRPKNPMTSLPKTWFQKYSSVQALIGLKKLNSISKIDDKRIHNVLIFKKYCPHAKLLPVLEYSHPVYWQLVIKIESPINFQRYCLNSGIDIATSSLLLISSLGNFSGSINVVNAKDQYLKSCIIPCNHFISSNDMMNIAKIVNLYDDQVNY